MNSDCDDPHSITSDTVSSELDTVSDDILDNNGDDFEECIEEDPAKQQLLSRLEQQSQEGGASSVSTRINFGIQEYKEPETHITIENSMRRVLNLGNENEKKKRRKPTKPPSIDKGYVGMENTRRSEPREGNYRSNRNKKTVKNDLIENVRKPFSDINLENEKTNGIKLNSLTQHNEPENTPLNLTLKSLPLNNLSKSNSGLTLNSLAQQHLNTSSQGPKQGINLSSLSLAKPKAGSGLSLSSLAQNHLAGTTSSSSGLSLSSLAQNHLAGSNSSSSGMSLSSMAQNHLAGNTSSSGLSLSSLAQSHLAGSTSSSSGTSLSSLATQHSGFSNGLHNSKSGLSGLAKLHLQDKGSTAGTKSGFTIPSLFGSSLSASSISPPKLPSTSLPKLPIVSPPLRAKTPEADIDLSSALRSSTSPISLYTSPDKVSATPHRTDILVQDFSTSRRCDIRKRKSSPLGAVVVRKWSRCGGGEGVVVVVPPRELLDVEEFKFDVPSPDEAVIIAQAKAFNRPSLASSIISRPTRPTAAVQ